MRGFFVLAITLFAVLLSTTNCKKNNSGIPQNPNSLTVSDTANTNMILSNQTSGNTYSITAIPILGKYKVTITFNNGRPAANATYTLSAATGSYPSVVIAENSTSQSWTANSGTLTVTVGSATTYSFNNAICIPNESSASNITVSCSLSQ